jgi:cell division protein FtsI (penicillin-binding protein 3)
MINIDARIKRLIGLGAVAFLIWGALVYRLVDIQLVHGSTYAEIARKQSSGKMEIPADRGIIYDRTGRELAINVMKNSLFVDPANKKEIEKIYSYLDKLYRKPSGFARRKYNLKPDKFCWIDRSLPDDLAALVTRDSIPGLFISKASSRDYPFNEVGRNLIGWTNIDGEGASGLEYSYDSILVGKPGATDYLRDGNRNTYRLRDIPLVEPVAGNSIILSIDLNFQEIVEDEIKKAVEKYNAIEGTALFLDCHSGEILAAADYVADGKNDAIKLRAVSNAFEPGSVFKIVTAAAVIDEKKFNLYERVNCENGAWRMGRNVLHDDHREGMLTFQETFEKSSNIGTAKMALRIGGKKLSEAARRFGFGQRYFVGLPGETPGMIGNPGKWSDYNVAALAMGHSVSVTALQLAAATAAIANGGKLYRPRLIKAILDPNGKPVKRYEKEQIATVIKPESVPILHRFMAGVVDTGTGKQVKSNIVKIAGKTGTAEVPDLTTHTYKKNKFVATFVGFFPADNPQVAGVVVLHQPEPIHYGGATSGPTFKTIAERYTMINPEHVKSATKLVADGKGTGMNEVPDFIGREVKLARVMAKRCGVEFVCSSENGIVGWQYPEAGRKIAPNGRVAAAVQPDGTDSLIVPDMTGLDLRTAISMLQFQKIDYEIIGSGLIQSQEPLAGTTVDKMTKCRLTCGHEIIIDEDTTKKSN